jgi:hypothetical protein
VESRKEEVREGRMRVIIAGSRHIIDMNELREALNDSGFLDDMTEIVCGCAPGADELGLIWGTNNDIPVKRMPAKWQYGKTAGRERNIAMAHYGDALVALWDGASSGTAHMIKVARMQGLQVHVRIVKDE